MRVAAFMILALTLSGPALASSGGGSGGGAGGGGGAGSAGGASEPPQAPLEGPARLLAP